MTASRAFSNLFTCFPPLCNEYITQCLTLKKINEIHIGIQLNCSSQTVINVSQTQKEFNNI